MADYVFSLGLIPVQEWIGEARRSRDLRTGSVLLGYLTAKVLARLAEQPGTEVLVPAPSIDLTRLQEAESFADALRVETYGIPNRASGYLAASDDDEARKLLAGLEPGVIVGEWERLKVAYLGGLDQQIGSSDGAEVLRALWEDLPAYLDLAKGGVDCPFSLVWVALPVPPRPGAEAPDREERVRRDLEKVDEGLASVKRSRPVRPWTLGAEVGKCTQCGRREALGPRRPERGKSLFATWRDWHQALVDSDEKKGRWLQRGFLLDAGERLCHVCLLKRLAAYDAGPTVRSTGEVAAGRWIEALRADPATRPACEAFLEEVKQSKLDAGRSLYLSPARLAALDPEGIVAARAALAEALKSRPDLTPRPPSYLALLTFDGDDMGRRLRTEPLAMPARLNEFGQAARAGLREAHGAEIFYLAGDEGLAMVPAVDGLAAALTVRKLFAAQLGAEATLSAGVAFFEHARPMAGAIRAAREALEAAKARPGKNALGVAVETASGSRWRWVEEWGPAWERVATLVARVQDGTLSASWAYDLETFLESLSEEAWGREEVRHAVRCEARRLLERRTRFPPGMRLSPEEKRRRRDALWKQIRGDAWWKAPPGVHPERAPQQLHLVGFLARQGTLVPPAEAREG